MRRKSITAVSILFCTVAISGCLSTHSEISPNARKAVLFQTNLVQRQELKFEIEHPKGPRQIPNPKLPKTLQDVQLFFMDVRPVYPDRLDEPVPNDQKQGAIIGLISQVAESIGANGKLSGPTTGTNSFFYTTQNQLRQLKGPSTWHRIEKDINQKIGHLHKAQVYCVNKSFDGYLQTIINQLQTALREKDYRTYAEASKSLIRLNHIIEAVAKPAK